MAKFTDREARALREEFVEFDDTPTAFARHHGVSKHVMRGLLLGHTYPDAGGPLHVPETKKGKGRWRDTRFGRELVERGISHSTVSVDAGLSASYFYMAVRDGRRPNRRWVRAFVDLTGADWPVLEDYPEGHSPVPPVEDHWDEFENALYVEIWDREEGSVATAQARWPLFDIRRILGPRCMNIPRHYWK